MNAYFLMMQHDITVYYNIGLDVPVPEQCRPNDLVFAETRGKARALFLAHNPDLEWTDRMWCRLVRANVDRAEGVARYDDILWADVCFHEEDGQLVRGDHVAQKMEMRALGILSDYRDYPASEGDAA